MKIALSIIALLLVSTFAMAIALADDSETIEDAIATETAETVAEVIPETTQDAEIADVAAELEEIAPSVQAVQAKQRYLGMARVSAGDGFAISSDGTEGERITAFWASARYVSVDPVVVKNLTRQYKGEPERLRAELAALATETVVVRATGRFEIGFGSAKEKFKLMKKEFTNTSVTFYLLPINTNLADLKDATDDEIASRAAGTLKLDAEIYPHLTVWRGTLELNSGAYEGSWEVTASSLSKAITTQNIQKVKVKAAAAVATQAGKPATSADAAEGTAAGPQQNVPRKIGFWERLMFWRRPNA